MYELFVDAVSKSYKGKGRVLDEVSFRLDTGIVGLVGPNGAGKTTLLKLLATLLRPTEGSITWNGLDLVRHPEQVRRILGYVPQDFGVYPQITARMFLHYIGELKGLRGNLLQERISAVLETVHLSANADQKLKTFSGGMVRRLGIAQALLNSPHLLILDEPTAGLDPLERVRFRETLATLQNEHLILFSTHIMSDIENSATHLLLLNHGRMIWQGTPEALLADTATAVWILAVTPEEFSTLHRRYRVSNARQRQGQVEMRILAEKQPHALAVPTEPTLEEAYLMFQIGQGMAEVSDSLA